MADKTTVEQLHDAEVKYQLGPVGYLERGAGSKYQQLPAAQRAHIDALEAVIELEARVQSKQAEIAPLAASLADLQAKLAQAKIAADRTPDPALPSPAAAPRPGIFAQPI